jgi:hypothetical protein
MKKFWDVRDKWLPTWGWVQQVGGSGGVGWVPGAAADQSALVIDSVYVWQRADQGATVYPPHWGDRAAVMLAADGATGARRAQSFDNYTATDAGAEGGLSSSPECGVDLHITATLHGPCDDIDVQLV